MASLRHGSKPGKMVPGMPRTGQVPGCKLPKVLARCKCVTSHAHESDTVNEPPSIEAVCWALDQTPMPKLFQHILHYAAWRAATPCLAHIVHDVKRIWRTATVPQHFRDGWLVLTQKLHKPGRSPGDYRPPRCLNMPRRARIWRTCVWTTLITAGPAVDAQAIS